MFDTKTILENENYEVLFTNSMSSNVTVVFSSAGTLALAQPVEEFKKTISHFETSYVFVRSKHLDWYNNENAIKTFRQIAGFCNKFQRVYVVGESLGGSGAIIFSDYCKNIHRILAFSPQYSVLPQFCKWYGPLTPVDGAIEKYVFSDYSTQDAVSKAVLIYPSLSYEDNLHAKFFQSEGFNVVYLKTGDHAIARFLKNAPDSNLLMSALHAMYDDAFAFNKSAFESLLSGVVQTSKKPFVRWIGDMTFKWDVFIDEPNGEIISAGRKATLSSVCRYSYYQDKDMEATRALTEPLSTAPSFHSGFETNPWWMIDLDSVCYADSMLIFNRCDNIDWSLRFMHFHVDVSNDLVVWNKIYEKTDASHIGGEYGKPALVYIKRNIRYLRIVLNGEDFLHLSKINIYGISNK